jgi:hypothetical protein
MKSEKNKKTPAYGKLKNFIIDQNLDQRLSRAAAEDHCSVSALIRRCCHEALKARESRSKNANG